MCERAIKMKNLIIIILLIIPFTLFGQQWNHTWGYTTAGVAYTQTGYQGADSSTSIDIIIDLQDLYPMDWNPLVLENQPSLDSSETVYNVSAYTYLGTFWWMIDAENATDSTGHTIKAYPGFMTYYPGTGDRISTSNITFSTTATTLLSETAEVNDIQWRFVNVYVNSSADASSQTTKHGPPEFVKINISFQTMAADSMDVYWDDVYPAVYQREQSNRSTTNSGNAKKAPETLH